MSQERWILQVYGMGQAVPECYEFRNPVIAQTSMNESCDGITARWVNLVHVDGEQFALVDHWRYSQEPRR